MWVALTRTAWHSGETHTMPLAAYLALETDPEIAILLSLVLLAVSMIMPASRSEN